MTNEELAAKLVETNDLIQTGWTLVCAALVMFMQAGFACVEAGSVRHKNSINVAIKNVIDFCISFPGFFIVGYALMFGATNSGWVGKPTYFLTDLPANKWAFFFFQVTFCGTAATIVSGAVAERCRFFAYMLVSAGISVIIYPIYGHWVWGSLSGATLPDGTLSKGWLEAMKFHDFAGSSVVHMLGGGVALAGIQILGPRHDKYELDGSARMIPASSMPLVALGVFILMFGWVGFNGGSAALGPMSGKIITNTILAGCVAGVMALLTTWALNGVASIEIVLNGLLGGLVAITANADWVSPTGAFMIGIMGGVTTVVATLLLDWMKLDDAVGAVPVHFFCGILGIVCTAVFCEQANLTAMEITRTQFLSIQCGGAAVCAVWAYLTGLILWTLVGYVTKARVEPLEEQVGLNYSEHKIEDAIHDLATVVSRVTREGPEVGLPPFDNVRDSETAALVNAIRALVERVGEQLRGVVRNAGRLEEVRLALIDQQSQGKDMFQRMMGDLNQTDQSLEQVVKYLGDNKAANSLFPVLLDLVARLRQQIQRLAQSLPNSAASWDTVQNLTGRLNQIKTQLVSGGK